MKCALTFIWHFNCKNVKQSIDNEKMVQKKKSLLNQTTGDESRDFSWMVEWSSWPWEEKEGKKTATKEQNSLVASLRTCSSFSWSEYSHCVAATAAAARAQTGTQRPYDTEIKYSIPKSHVEWHGAESKLHILFVLLNYPAHRTFHMRKPSMMNGCQRQSDMVDLSNRA